MFGEAGRTNVAPNKGHTHTLIHTHIHKSKQVRTSNPQPYTHTRTAVRNHNLMSCVNKCISHVRHVMILQACSSSCTHSNATTNEGSHTNGLRWSIQSISSRMIVSNAMAAITVRPSPCSHTHVGRTAIRLELILIIRYIL